ncbi:MAG: ATP-binding protein [Thermomicrobiales bacterium]
MALTIDQDVLWLRNRAIDSTRVSVVIADARNPDLPILDVNPAFVRLTGYDPNDVIGSNCRFLQGARTGRTVKAEMRSAIQEARELQVVILNYRKDGSPFWNEVNVSPVYDSRNTLTHFVATQMDVSKQIRSDSFLQLLNDVDLVLADCDDPSSALEPVAEKVVRHGIADACLIHIVDSDGELRVAASTTSRTLNRHPELELAILNQMRTDVVPEFVQSCFGEVQPQSKRFHEKADDGDGSESAARFGIVVAPITVPGRRYGTISFAVDGNFRQIGKADDEVAIGIAKRLGSILEMNSLYADLRSAVDVRDEFLSIAAHELRTPIAGIKGYSQLLLRGLERGTLLPERLRLGLQTIESSASRLTLLTNDLLEVSRAGKNTMPLHLEPVSVYDFVVTFLNERRTLKPDQHSFNLVSEDPGVWIDADVGRLEQVLSNLANNAVKYSPDSLSVDLSIEADTEGVTVSMCDYGMGLAASDLERIFQPYLRASLAAASEIPGMGLGLFISRNIAEQHHGTLTATSDGPDQGTTFRFWLPIRSPNSKP